MIGGAFGTVIIVANAKTPLGPTAAVIFRIVGVVGLILVLIAWRRALGRTLARRPGHDYTGPNLFGRRYWQIVGSEATLLAIGFVAIWGVGAPSQTYLAWTTLVVGRHFIAFRLTGVWRESIHRPSALLILFGVGGLLLAATSSAEWIPLVGGVLPAITLLAGSLAVAIRAARSPAAM